MAKRRKKNTHGAGAYAAALIIYVLILAVVIVFGLTRLWDYAKTIDAVVPEATMDVYIEQLKETIWDQGMATTVAAMPHEFQTDAECVDIVRNMLEGEWSYRRRPGSSDASGIVEYDLICGKNLIGKATVVRDESKRGTMPDLQIPWIVQSNEFYVDGLYTSLKFTVPENYTVRINNVVVGEQYIVERGIHYDVLEPYYSQFDGLPTKVTYEVHNIFGVQQPVVYDEDGNIFVYDESRNDMQYIKQPPQETFARLEAFAIAFSDAYKHFSAGTGDPTAAIARLNPYIIQGSDLEKRLWLALDGYDWAHTVSYEFNGAVLNSAIDVGGGYYILDVTTETTVVYPNKGDNGTLHEFGGLTIIAQDFGTEYRVVTVENY